MADKLADEDTLIEYDQIRFIYQNHPAYNLHTRGIGVAVLGSHQSKTSLITVSYEIFSQPSYVHYQVKW